MPSQDPGDSTIRLRGAPFMRQPLNPKQEFRIPGRRERGVWVEGPRSTQCDRFLNRGILFWLSFPYPALAAELLRKANLLVHAQQERARLQVCPMPQV